MKVLTKSNLSECIVEVDNPKSFLWTEVFNKILDQDQYVVKVNLVKSTKDKLYFHVVHLDNFKGFVENPFYPYLGTCVQDKKKPRVTASCLIIPTGVGARYGGYAGDANVVARLLAKSCDLLIANPNVVNGAVLSEVPENLVYVEGFLLDQFLLGKLYLFLNNKNKIGVIFDKGINDERLGYELNVLNALKVFYGCNILGWTQTEKPLKITPSISEYGFSCGEIEGLEYLIDKALKLKHSGATAIAVCCVVPDLDLNNNYISGIGIDPIGGIESIISHVISASTGLVCAHAPVLEPFYVPNYKDINPVSGSEYIAKSFLPSVISGLRFAPKVVKAANTEPMALSSNGLIQIIVPYNAFGSAPVMNLMSQSKKIILVRENKTCLQVNPEDLNVNFKVVNSYLDIINSDVVESLGINLDVLRRPVDKILKL